MSITCRSLRHKRGQWDKYSSVGKYVGYISQSGSVRIVRSASRKKSFIARETVKKKKRSYFLDRNVCGFVNSNVFHKFGIKLGRLIELYVHDVDRKKNDMDIGEKQLFFLALANHQQKTM